jgi:hypothetical protein
VEVRTAITAYTTCHILSLDLIYVAALYCLSAVYRDCLASKRKGEDYERLIGMMKREALWPISMAFS